jgi:hypothetical protein
VGSKDLTRMIAFGFVLVILVLGVGCTAKDYNERVGSYEVNFSLPDELASNMTISKDTGVGEGANFNWYDTYSIALQKQGANESWGRLLITHYNMSAVEDLVIDGHDAIIFHCFDSERRNEYYHFHYQLDNRTTVDGNMSLNYTALLPFLKSLHVREVA